MSESEDSALYLGEYQGIDCIGRWCRTVALTGARSYYLCCRGSNKPAAIGVDSVFDAAGALLRLDRYYREHPERDAEWPGLEKEMRLCRDRAIWRALPWYKRWWFWAVSA